MSGETKLGADQGDVAVSDVPPLRDVAFTLLSILIETAGTQMRPDKHAGADEVKPSSAGNAPELQEARIAIDAANALLGAVRSIMENDAVLAIEGMLAQLQFEYVRRLSQSS